MKGRARTFEPNLLAAFPAVDGISTIVIGTPEATGQDPMDVASDAATRTFPSDAD